jgi:hypothetical protein
MPRDPSPIQPTARPAATAVTAVVPSPSAVWTRPAPAWKLGLRAASASLGSVTLVGYLLYVRPGLLPWSALAALELGLASAAGLAVGWLTWARRARLGALLASGAIAPWFWGACLSGLAGLGLGAALSGGRSVGALAGAVLGPVAWTTVFARWWGRRHPIDPPDGVSNR